MLLQALTFSVQVLLVFFVLNYFVKSSLKNVGGDNPDWARWSFEFLTPFYLVFIFGLCGLITFFSTDIKRLYGVDYDGVSVLLFAIYVIVGSLCYLSLQRLSFGGIKRTGEIGNIGRSGFIVVLVGMWIFDWYVRFDQIRGGIYFAWLANFSETAQASVRTTSLIYHLHDTVAYVFLALVTFAAMKWKNNKFLLLLLLIQVLLLLLQGQRRVILFSLAVIVLVALSTSALKIGRKVFVRTALMLLLTFGFLGPLIQDVRIQMRFDARSLSENPGSIPVLLVTEYIPRSLGLVGDSQGGVGAVQHTTVMFRLASYMNYAATINYKYLDGSDTNLENFGAAFSTLIPRIFWPDKISIDANDMVYSAFGFGRMGFDSAGSPVSDIFSFLHLPGIVILLSVVGVFIGLITRFLRRAFGQFGDVFSVGLMPTILPLGDSFAQYLAEMRNILVVIFLLIIVAVGLRLLSVRREL